MMSTLPEPASETGGTAPGARANFALFRWRGGLGENFLAGQCAGFGAYLDGPCWGAYRT